MSLCTYQITSRSPSFSSNSLLSCKMHSVCSAPPAHYLSIESGCRSMPSAVAMSSSSVYVVLTPKERFLPFSRPRLLPGHGCCLELSISLLLSVKYYYRKSHIYECCTVVFSLRKEKEKATTLN